jgi:hypothetical protein
MAPRFAQLQDFSREMVDFQRAARLAFEVHLHGL